MVVGWVDYGRLVPEPSMGVIIIGLKIPFLYNNDGRYVWNEQQQQQRQYNIVSFVLSKLSIDLLSLKQTRLCCEYKEYP